jgi:hypothetical protein
VSASSDRWRKPKCNSGKAAWRTRGEADRALERIRNENAQAVAPLEIPLQRSYKCRCGAWHLTSQDQRTERKPRQAREQRARRRRRRNRVSVPQSLRHLHIAPETVAAPPAEVAPVAFDPSDPISDARRAHWERAEGERIKANLAHPFPWRRSAA